ncbi:molybdate ABC transporter substrate-binding protein [Granulicella cerasi]|uniref:Molybdate ABC transporter substrate-binding protein n=1 Tax=Granulicella cerasi TaxID=741063 RepID=A0ABW1ZFL2_9BACT|nr:molybdate ABC transporter substrate-binding protein [Granulicella cerasi]
MAVLLTLLSAHKLIAQAKELHVAAAADLAPVLPILAAQYEKQTGVKVIASFGSSAALTTQLQNGAPFDVFLSADTAHPQQLADAHLSDGALMPYAHGTLVLWARKDSVAQPLTLASLQKPEVTRIAMANPTHAPYGLAAKQYLTHEHLIAALATKLVTAENIAQTAQFAESGNAQAGLISLTTANTPHFREIGSYVLIPQADYAPLVQAAVVMHDAKDRTAAHAFLKWLTCTKTQAQLKPLGLEPVR